MPMPMIMFAVTVPVMGVAVFRCVRMFVLQFVRMSMLMFRLMLVYMFGPERVCVFMNVPVFIVSVTVLFFVSPHNASP